MRIVCPHCSARLQLPAAPEPDTAVRCPKCREEFFPAAEEAAPAPTRSAYRRPDPTAGKKFPVVLVGVAGALLVAGGIAIAVLVGGGDKPAADKGKANPAPEPQKKDVRGGPKSGPEPAVEKLPPELAALFRAPVADPPTPTAFVPTLERDPRAAETSLTAVAVPKKADAEPKEAPADDRTPEQVVEDVKRATVFIKIDGGTVMGSGSGFVVRADGATALVATNNHVVRDKDGTDRGKITVVFDSGLRPNEQEVPGQIVAADAAADLAVLRVTGVKRMPKPIDPRLAPKPTETMPVKISGFPFGEQLAAEGRNPDITIGPGSVSSIRHDAAGRVEKVQITGSINPGNSGGPVVDERGRLVGVTVSTIKGAGFGFAVPAPSLASMLDGRLLQPVFEGSGVEDGRAVFRVVVPIQDPLRRVKAVALRVLPDAGETTPVEADPKTGWKPLPGADAIELSVDPGRAATGSLRLPAGQKQSVAVVQLACTAADGAVALSPPLPFRLTRDGARAAGASIPVATLDRTPDKYDGQVVAVQGKMIPAALPKLGVFELDVVNENDAKPVNLLFLTAAEVAGQLRELPDASRAVPARLTCRVGKKGTDGIAPVRVTRIEFLDRTGRVRLTVPSDELEKDPLIALNRSPDKFLGQTLTLPALVSPTPLVKGAEAELVVLYGLSEKAPDNLAFVTTRDIAVQLNAEGAKEDAVPAMLTARVESKKLAGKRVVTVTRIVLFGADGKPRKTIE
jgi:S1-C subfamily serine protease